MAAYPKPRKYKPLNPNKILGDPDNLVSRSSWEYRCMYKFDTSDYILKWGSECLVIPYRSPKDNRVHRYFVDFVLVTKDKDDKPIVSVIEVKPYAQTREPRKTANKKESTYIKEALTYLVNQAKWSAAEEYCKIKGFQFIKMTEKEIFSTIK